jgi:hypothetical protein
MEKDFHTNVAQKQAGIAILISNKASNQNWPEK